jgi:L-asparaginase
MPEAGLIPEAGPLPVIAVLATGGTIAGAQTAGTTLNYVAGTFTVQQLLDAVPQLSSVAQLLPEQVANVGSQDMSHAIWHTLAARVHALCQDDAVDGIVITHGTDTLEETAYFLDLLIPRGKPVVLLGAMRPATALSADGPRNLYHAVLIAAAKQAYGRGPLVVMNEDIHTARDVQKIACTGVAAFASPNRGRAGVIQAGRPIFHHLHGATHDRPGREKSSHETPPLDRGLPFSMATLPAVESWPRVGVLYDHVGLQADVAAFLASQCAGVVLAGVGDGNASGAIVQALAAATARGIAVVRTTRTGSGYVARNVELDDNTAGFITGGDLNPQKARILLMLALTTTRDRVALQQLFDRC